MDADRRSGREDLLGGASADVQVLSQAKHTGNCRLGSLTGPKHVKEPRNEAEQNYWFSPHND